MRRALFVASCFAFQSSILITLTAQHATNPYKSSPFASTPKMIKMDPGIGTPRSHPTSPLGLNVLRVNDGQGSDALTFGGEDISVSLEGLHREFYE